MSKYEELRILYVEDNIDDVELLNLILKKSDLKCSVKHVSTWEEFQSVDLDGFDLIITDYNISGFTGLDVIKNVNSRKSIMPIIVLTGTVGEELAVDLVHAGADDFLLKPNIRKLPLIIHRVRHAIMLEAEKQKFQQEIVEKNLILDTILDSSQSAIFLKDSQRRYLKVNRAACVRLELRKDEIIGQIDDKLLPPDAAKKAREYDNYVLSHGEAVTYEMAYTDMSGKEVVEEVCKTPLMDGNRVIGIVGEVRDITKQVQLLDDLKKSQGILSQSENITDSGSFEYHSDLDLMTCSRNFKNMMGLKIEGSQISLRRMVMLLKEEDREIFNRGISEAIDNNHDYYGQHRLEIEGKTRVVKVFLRPDAQSVNSHIFFGTVIDITTDSDSSQSLFNQQENDRKEIARELHDNLGRGLMLFRCI